VLELNYRKPEEAQNSKLAFEKKRSCSDLVPKQFCVLPSFGLQLLGAHMLFILFS